MIKLIKSILFNLEIKRQAKRLAKSDHVLMDKIAKILASE